MVANPHGSRSEAVMAAIYNRVPALPESYIDDILASEDEYSPLEELEGNYISDLHLHSMIAEEIKAFYRNDYENAWAADSLVAFTSRLENLKSRYELASLHLYFGDCEEMDNVLSDIVNDFELNEQQALDYQNYLATFAIARDIEENNLHPGELSSEQILELEEIMEAPLTVLKGDALSLLKWNNPEYMWEEIILEPVINYQRKAKTSKVKSQDNELFRLYPNPANEFITIEYQTEELTAGKLTLLITDVSGRKLMEKPLKGGDNDELVDIRFLLPGVYTVSIISDKAVISAKKLTVLK
jgi:hypothetical protein